MSSAQTSATVGHRLRRVYALSGHKQHCDTALPEHMGILNQAGLLASELALS